MIAPFPDLGSGLSDAGEVASLMWSCMSCWPALDRLCLVHTSIDRWKQMTALAVPYVGTCCLDVPDPHQQSDDCETAEVQRRAQALARGLGQLMLAEGSTVLIVTCGGHELDRTVAELACAWQELLALPLDSGSSTLCYAISARPSLVLACREGSDAIVGVPFPCRVFGDRRGMSWWRALEYAHPSSG